MRKVFGFCLGVMVMLWFFVPVTLAQDNNTKELNLNEAITMALKNSNSIQKANLTVDKAKEQRDSAEDNISFTPSPGDHYTPAIEANWYNLLSADLSWMISKKNKTAAEDALVLSTCQKYWDVLTAQENVELAKAKLNKAQMDLQKLQAYLLVGMSAPNVAPQQAQEQSKTALAGANLELVAAENTLNNAYEALDKTIGISLSERPVLKDDVEYSKMEVANIDTFVHRVLAESPTIWSAEQSSKLAEYARDIAHQTGQYKSYLVRSIEQQQAEIDATMIKDSLDLMTRKFISNVGSLEETYTAAQARVKAAEEALRVSQVSYKVGVVTKYDVAQAELELASAKKAMLDNKYQHAYWKMACQKPWAVSQ